MQTVQKWICGLIRQHLVCSSSCSHWAIQQWVQQSWSQITLCNRCDYSFITFDPYVIVNLFRASRSKTCDYQDLLQTKNLQTGSSDSTVPPTAIASCSHVTNHLKETACMVNASLSKLLSQIFSSFRNLAAMTNSIPVRLNGNHNISMLRKARHALSNIQHGPNWTKNWFTCHIHGTNNYQII